MDALVVAAAHAPFRLLVQLDLSDQRDSADPVM
jgi:hypothetical protein